MELVSLKEYEQVIFKTNTTMLELIHHLIITLIDKFKASLHIKVYLSLFINKPASFKMQYYLLALSPSEIIHFIMIKDKLSLKFRASQL